MSCSCPRGPPSATCVSQPAHSDDAPARHPASHPRPPNHPLHHHTSCPSDPHDRRPARPTDSDPALHDWGHADQHRQARGPGSSERSQAHPQTCCSQASSTAAHTGRSDGRPCGAHTHHPPSSSRPTDPTSSAACHAASHAWPARRPPCTRRGSQAPPADPPQTASTAPCHDPTAAAPHAQGTRHGSSCPRAAHPPCPAPSYPAHWAACVGELAQWCLCLEVCRRCRAPSCSLHGRLS